MASHYTDNAVHGSDHTDPHLSQTRWRHEESSSYRRHASAAPREADRRDGSKDLADFLNTARVEPPGSAGSGLGKHQPLVVSGNVPSGTQAQSSGAQKEGSRSPTTIPDHALDLEVKCGPLLNYRRMENETWFGSVLVVTKFGGIGESPVTPQLHIKVVGTRPRSGAQYGIHLGSSTNGASEHHGVVDGVDYGSFNTPTSLQTSNDRPSATNGPESGSAVSWQSTVNGTPIILRSREHFLEIRSPGSYAAGGNSVRIHHFRCEIYYC